MGWVVWRTEADLPEELIFHVNYLGGDQPTFNLNFSRGASQIIAQYYNFLRLGRDGYRRIMTALQQNARYLTEQLEATGHVTMLSKPGQLPVVTFALKDTVRVTVFEVSEKLRERGWIVPAYTMAPNAESIAVLRIVVREGFTRDMADMLLEDFQRAARAFEARRAAAPDGKKQKPRGVC